MVIFSNSLIYYQMIKLNNIVSLYGEKDVCHNQFYESLLLTEKMRLIVLATKKTYMQAKPLPHIYFDIIFDNKVVENNLGTFCSSS